jgi:hypothetical protein
MSKPSVPFLCSHNSVRSQKGWRDEMDGTNPAQSLPGRANTGGHPAASRPTRGR